MSRWVRGIYNAAANFVMSGSLRAANGRTLDRRSKHLSKECDESNQHVESGESSKPIGCTSTSSTRTTADAGRTSTNGSRASTSATAQDGKLPSKHGDTCTCSLCRDYRDYILSSGSNSIRTEGQGAGSRIRVSNESRHFKRSSDSSTTDVEHITGIQPGVTI